MIQWHWSLAADLSWSTDRGLAYGDGLFETIAVKPSGPVLAEYHRDRLLAGCRFLQLPFDRTDWENWWAELRKKGWLQTDTANGHVLKLVITRGSGGRGYAPPAGVPLRAVCLRSAMPDMPRQPVCLQLGRVPVSPCPSESGLKTLSRLDQVLAAAELREDAFEVLMTDRQGRPVEGGRSNFFMLRDGKLQTAPVRDLAVAGVMRKALLDRAPALGLSTTEQTITWAGLSRCQGALITNSIIGVVPVQRIGCFNLPVAGKIADLQSFVRQELGI